MFMLSRTAPDSKLSQLHGVDEGTKTLVRSIFNDTSTRMIETYERKIDKQKQHIKQLTKELLDAHQLYKESLEKVAGCMDFQERLKLTIQEQAAISLRNSLSIPDALVALAEEV